VRRAHKTSKPLRERRGKREVETRERLLAAALELFSAHGFRKVTVRDISQRAGANLAAVSYHFGDKLGLYTEIVESAIRMMRAFADSSVLAAQDAAPEDKLRQFVLAYLPRVANPQGDAASMQRILRHELAEPTPLMRRVVEQGIMPRFRYLTEVIAQILECPLDDARVRSCVMSVQAQCLFFARDRVRTTLFDAYMPANEEELKQTAAYVAEFSLAGVRALARR
jgi:TetR/AcrR family transcriptional regulator, regulator of cefoperazone and chloramphenicol sensitivity